MYRFIPVERKDTVRDTGHPKYLPVKPCGDDGVKCELIVKNNPVMSTDRKKRMVFSNLGVLHNLEKRSGFTDGLLKAGEKLLDGSPGGFFMEMLKTIAKPVYNWEIVTEKMIS